MKETYLIDGGFHNHDPIFFYHKSSKSSTASAFDGVVTPSGAGLPLFPFPKAWSVKNGKRFTKNAFVLDWESQTICCPNQVKVTFSVGGVVKFTVSRCHCCPLQERCTTSPKERSLSIHPAQKFLRELRERQLTPMGRQQLREQV